MRNKTGSPVERLVEDLRVRRLSPSKAAGQAKLDPHSVCLWVRGESRPRRAYLRRLLEANAIDPIPYEAYLASLEPVVVVCPRCGLERELPRSQLAKVGPLAKGRTVLPRRTDGKYERLCLACLRRYVGRPALKRANKERRAAAEALGCRPIEVNLEPQQSKKGLKRFLEVARAPRSERHRRAIGEGHLQRGDLKRLGLCLLCGLLVHGRGKVEWHKRCLSLFHLFWRRCHPDAPKAPPRARGRPGDENLDRNLRWLLWREKGTRTRADLLTTDRRRLARYRRRVRGHKPSRSIVNAGVKSVIQHLPGSWEIVFGSGRAAGPARRTGRWSGQNARVRRNRIEFYQKRFPLPEKLRSLVEAGRRDPLIRRLHSFGMRVEKISALTGAPLERVLRVVSDMPAALSGAARSHAV